MRRGSIAHVYNIYACTCIYMYNIYIIYIYIPFIQYCKYYIYKYIEKERGEDEMEGRGGRREEGSESLFLLHIVNRVCLR